MPVLLPQPGSVVPPEPITVVVQGNSTDWLDPTTLVPLIVSIVALLGVVFSNWYSARNMNKAEEKRRHAAADAEALRHENDLNRALREHLIDVVREAYVNLEGARRELTRTAERLSNTYPKFDAWVKFAGSERKAFDDALTRFSGPLDSIKLIGSNEVGDIAEELYSSAAKLRFISMAVNEDITFSEEALHLRPSFDDLHREFERVQRLSTALLAAMRKELHG
ncbi:hypothetical protein [Promicromonospora sp. MEB111]|uniref:hypothetical protein n=1 Tax=Promicromonospora sp. MEB111 TaxID=3040301 RepID=UPI00254A648F|nr:hypothetical protein [Promicromonospora sp. MEB111]